MTRQPLENDAVPPAGIPGLRGSDHIGFTVPDMEEAHDFLTRILGCVHVYTLGPYPTGTEIAARLDIGQETLMEQIRFYRCRTGVNFEVFQYADPGQRTDPPRNSDVGGHHVAFYVDDLDAAVLWLRENGVEVLAGPNVSSGPSEGQRWIYFRAPWGMYFELVSFPGGKAYEREAETLLWDCRAPQD
ncbi:VOC family protein [Rothia halotolerans]|uniref:VOC family protein n=1 Tax=Rothia halotolerans TaxID=405770 RepID=UPI00101B5AEC|nr:VOC family protein [Rothia halotolerans]